MRSKPDVLRNLNLMQMEAEYVDDLFTICDAEFNSRKDVHDNFAKAKGAASWARYFLKDEVRKVAFREEWMASDHLCQVVASQLARIWFEQRDPS